MLGLIATNLGRRPARALLTSMGIALGVGTIVALLALTSGLNNSANGLIHLGKADLGLFQSDTTDPTASVLPLSLLPRVQARPEVAQAAPVVLVTGAVPREPAAIVFGARPQDFLSRRLVLESGRRAQGAQAMVGDVLATRKRIHVGSTITLRGRSLPVVGIYHAGVLFEDEGVVVPLPVAQQLAGRLDSVTTIAVLFKPQVSLADGKRALERAFPGTIGIADPNEAARADANVRLISKAVVVIVLLALVIGGIAVTNTMVLALVERQRELALLAAVGWSPRQIATLILGEGVALSLVGGAIGLVLGVAGSELAVRALSASAFVSPDVTAWGLGRGLIVGIAIGLVGGLYPAWRVTRLSPAQVLARG